MKQRLKGGPAPSTTPMTVTCLAIGNVDQNGAAADELGLGISKGESLVFFFPSIGRETERLRADS